MLDGLRAARIDHGRVPGEHHARPEDRAAPDVNALHHDAPRPDEGVVLDHDRDRLERLEDAADPDPSREVNVRTDLRARSDRHPCVDHRSAPDVRPDVHVARHQHDPRLQVRTETDRRRRDDADALLLVAVLERKLVVVLERARLGRLEPAHPEVQQHGLLRPGVDAPSAAVSRIGLGDPERSSVEEFDRRLHRRRVDRGGRVFGHAGPAPLDPFLELQDVPHVRTSASRSSSADAARAQSSIGGTIAIRTNPSPSGPKNDPGATTMSLRSRR